MDKAIEERNSKPEKVLWCKFANKIFGNQSFVSYTDKRAFWKNDSNKNQLLCTIAPIWILAHSRNVHSPKICWYCLGFTDSKLLYLNKHINAVLNNCTNKYIIRPKPIIDCRLRISLFLSCSNFWKLICMTYKIHKKNRLVKHLNRNYNVDTW